jgi:ubiquinone/menaquinone biosynthesis C-methylase UbiE
MKTDPGERSIPEGLSFAKRYHKLYHDLSPLSHLFNTRIDRVRKLLGSIAGLDILDVGCGPGDIARHIRQNGGRYFGIDLSKDMLVECQSSQGGISSIYLSQAEVNNLPFLDSSFDVALCLGVLEYVEDLEAAFEELTKVLRDHGIVILSMQNPFGIYRLWARYVHSGSLFNAVRKLLRRPAVGRPGERVVSLRDLKSILSQHGLIVKDTQYYNFNLLLKPLDGWLPNLSVMISRRLEWLHYSPLGSFLAADYIVYAIWLSQTSAAFPKCYYHVLAAQCR